jgi:MOSC domain-containing protein YiiM
MAHVVSVNVGTIVEAAWAGRPRRTAIRKHAVEGPVRVLRMGLEGDEVADTRYHGGIHAAVYAYAQEDLDHWSAELGRTVPPGTFGENLTTAGIDVNGALLGERWRIGSALVSPVDVRTPCTTFRTWMAREGYDATGWVRRFAAHGRAGPYLRVLEEGTLRAGDPVVVEDRPDHGVTVTTMFRALMGERELLPRLLDVDGLPERVYRLARAAQGDQRVQRGPEAEPHLPLGSRVF